ncbi:LysR family transcriptional regulator [Nonomuraea pusilla]|uniref:DNA-binding transcriptional regulator, LysR family n=1 Tax=Nonomuraea pusilla TaxID=46177 RepID=A0A1H7IAY1_9ACTN|nr:LysR family transcriptional regulator [Nonomuraea pusilla]SEK59691.1 DNA-binding transcriptional regulator, LysR family [Nonomuraea pusilla]
MAWDLRRLRYFVVVAEELHFGRAAQRLRIAQPSLSQQIKALEKAVGATLLERTPRGVRLTPAGATALEAARELLAGSERALLRVRERAAAGRTELRVGVSTGIGSDVLNRVCAGAAEAGVSVGFRDAGVAEQARLLTGGTLGGQPDHGADHGLDHGPGHGHGLDHRLDLGLVLEPLGPLEAAGLRLARLSDEPLGVVAAAGSPLPDELPDELSAGDLTGRGLLWIGREEAPGYHDHVLEWCHAAGWRPEVVVTPTRRLGAVVALLTARSDLVSLVPAGKAVHPGLAWRPLRDAPRHRVALAWHAGDGRESVARLRAALAGPHSETQAAHKSYANPLHQAAPVNPIMRERT